MKFEPSDDLTGGCHLKEARLRVRCGTCGRVLRGAESRKRGICCICEAADNLDQIWARRIKLGDSALLEVMRRKIKLPDLTKPIDFSDDPLLKLLKKKVGKP